MSAFLLALVIAIAFMTFRGSKRVSCQQLLYGAFLAIVATTIGRFWELSFGRMESIGWLFLRVVANIILSLSIPGLWGAAFAHEEDLSSSRIARVSRLFAGCSLAGLLAIAGAVLAHAWSMGPRGLLRMHDSLNALPPLVTSIAGWGMLFWASVESLRPCLDEIVVRDRARRIQVLMTISIVSTFIASLFGNYFWQDLFGRLGYPSQMPMLTWHAFVQLTLNLVTTILVAIALENPVLVHEPRNRRPVIPTPPTTPDTRDTSPIDVP